MAEKAGPVTDESGFLTVTARASFADVPYPDILLVGGGTITGTLVPHHPIVAWIAKAHAKTKWTTSVCTGSMLLGQAGLLEGRHATTHWRALPWMRDSFPGVTVEEKQHVVEDGNVLTSAGISAGIDMALRVVARYHGEAVARNTARNMEYRYAPEDNSRRV